MGEVATHATAFLERFRRGLGGARVLVAKDDVRVHVVADRLHTRPAGRCFAEQVPGNFGQQIGIAIAAAQQKHQCLFRQRLHCVLLRGWCHNILLAGVANHAIGRQLDPTFGRDHARAPVAERIAIAGNRHGRVRDQVIGHHDVGNARVVHVQRQQHGRGLRAVVNDLVAESDKHCSSSQGGVVTRCARAC